MSKQPTPMSQAALDRAVIEHDTSRYVLRLYIAGLTPRSVAAIAAVKHTCEEHLAGRYDLEVVNLQQNPTLARGEQILAAPTLIKQLPLPLRRLIGDMADTKKLLVGLDLRTKEEKA